MLLTLTTTHTPATDLGYLLHKSPARAQEFSLPFGTAHVFYPEASEERCTAALLLEIDPVGLVRDRQGPAGAGHALEQYVNDRPYAASSFLSVAIARVLGSALGGRSKDRPELAAQAIPLEAHLPALPCRGGEGLLRRLFEPLGYEVQARVLPLDEATPSRYFAVTLTGTKRVSELLTHLYVLIPVLDDDKHYWVGDDEVEKLLRHGEGWLAAHPARETITQRYLRHQASLARAALSRLLDEDVPRADEIAEARAAEEVALERSLSLNEQRLEAVVAELEASGARRVLDLGCGEGRLLKALFKRRGFDAVVGADVSHRALEIAHSRLGLERMSESQRARLSLFQASLTYRDARFAGYDAVTVVEVVEHLDPPRLEAFERVLFEFAHPACVVLTTPNAEYNVKFESLPAGRFRHRDHRFEWTRAEFETWAGEVAARNGYAVRFVPIGPLDAQLGAPTQMAVFTVGGRGSPPEASEEKASERSVGGER